MENIFFPILILIILLILIFITVKGVLVSNKRSFIGAILLILEFALLVGFYALISKLLFPEKHIDEKSSLQQLLLFLLFILPGLYFIITYFIIRFLAKYKKQ